MIIILLIVLALAAIWCINTVNGFKKKEIRVQEGLSGVEVALTKRYDMLTKMLDTAKGYMAHETDLFERVIALRRGMSIGELNDAQQQMDSLSGKLFAVAEGTPSCAPARCSSSCSGASGTPRSTCRQPGGCITPASPPITRPSPCSRQSCWPEGGSPRSFSPRRDISGKM